MAKSLVIFLAGRLGSRLGTVEHGGTGSRERTGKTRSLVPVTRPAPDGSLRTTSLLSNSPSLWDEFFGPSQSTQNLGW